MRGQFIFIFIFIISINAHSVQSASDIHITARNGQAIYDSKISYSAKDIYSWSITEALANGSRIQTDTGSYLDNWDLELHINENFDDDYLNDQDKIMSVEQAQHSNFLFKILFKDNGDSVLADYDQIMNNESLGLDARDLVPGFPWYPFLNVDGSNPEITSLSYIQPTMTINGKENDNRFEFEIQEVLNQSVEIGATNYKFEHSIFNNNYHLYEQVERNDLPIQIDTLELSINVKTGILNNLKISHDSLGPSRSFYNTSLEVQFNDKIASKIRIGEFSIPQILLVTPILIIAIFVIYRRLKQQ